MNKGWTATIFYLFLIIFIISAYLYKKGFLTFLSLEVSQKKPVETTKKKLVDIEFKDKEYQENFSQKNQNSAIELAQFEKEEPWEGEFDLDATNVIDGETSLSILSKNGQTTTIKYKKRVNLSALKLFKIYVYIPKEEIINDITNLTLKFSLTDSSFFEYPILNIKAGWNLVQMPKEKFTASKQDDKSEALWENIDSIIIELAARSNAKVMVSLDRLWAEKNADYQKDFFVSSANMISLKNYSGKTYINVLPFEANLALIKKVTSVKNFTYTAKIIPQNKGSFGINARTDINTGYGYYLEMGGIDSASWQLYKIGQSSNGSSTTKLDAGEISNFLLEPNKAILLKIQVAGSKIRGYISSDGINFTKLTEKNDDELKTGGIGINTSSGSFLLESIDLKQ